MEVLKVGSDFSGIGAFIQGLNRLNVPHKEVFACDMDKYSRKTYCLNYGTAEDILLSESKEHDKICDAFLKYAKEGAPSPDTEPDQYKIYQKLLIEGEELARKFSFYYPIDVYHRQIPEDPVDDYVSTPPCQAFSLAGKRKGEEDRRGILFYNSHEFIAKNKPRRFIFENVKGLLSDDGGKTFQRWVDLLGGKSVNGNPVIFPHEESVPYHLFYKVLNAKEHGVPQNRERIFIIGFRDDSDFEFKFPKPLPLTKKLKDCLESEVDEKYFLSDKMVQHLLKHPRSQEPIDRNTDFANTLTANYSKQSSDLQYLKEDILLSNSGQGRKYESREIAPPLRSHDGCGHDNFVVIQTIPPSLFDEDILIGSIKGRNEENPKDRTPGISLVQTLEINLNNVANALTTVQKDNVLVIKQKRTDEAKELRKESKRKNNKDTGKFSDREFIAVPQEFSDTILANENPAKEGLILVENQSEKTDGVIVLGNLSGGKWDKTHEQSRRVYSEEGIAPSINTASVGQQHHKIVVNSNTEKGFEVMTENDSLNFSNSNSNSKTRRGRVGKEIAQTLDTACNQAVMEVVPEVGYRIRRFTPLECFRLMDFPDTFKWLVSDTQAYKQAGNSIPVAFFQHIYKKILFNGKAEKRN